MALIQVGPIVSDIRGSINGVTYGRNRAGLFARQRVKPIDPGAPLQIIARNQLTLLSLRWGEELSPAQRSSWRTLALTTVFQNSLGIDFNPSGFNLYIRSNSLQLRAGAALTETAPTRAVIQLGVITIAHTVGIGLEITDINGTEVTGGTLIAQLSPPMSRGIKFFKGPFTQSITIDVVALATLPVLVIPNPILVPDANFFVRLRVIQDDGSATSSTILGFTTPSVL